MMKTTTFVIQSIAIVVLFFSVFISAMACSIPSATELEKDIPIKCSTNYTLVTNCLIESFDANGNVVNTWNSIPDDNGYLLRSINFGNNYAVGQNYTVNVTCGSDVSSSSIFVDVPGNLVVNLFAVNVISYVNAHPLEVVAELLIVFVVFSGSVLLIRFVRK